MAILTKVLSVADSGSIDKSFIVKAAKMEKVADDQSKNEIINLCKKYLADGITSTFKDFAKPIIEEKLTQLCQSLWIDLDISTERISTLNEVIPFSGWGQKANLTKFLIAEEFGLQKSKWNPIDGVDLLIKNLKLTGPLLIVGHFGIDYYESEPYKLAKQIGARDIYAWKPGSKRIIRNMVHVVLVIGALKIQEVGRVLFIDTGKASDPKDLSSQRIYMISYENLKEHIFNSAGIKEKVSNNSSLPYAWHGSFAKD